MNLISQIESILFVASAPVGIRKITEAVQASEEEVKNALLELQLKYNHSESGLRILSVEDKFQMATSPDNTAVVDLFIKEEAVGELTRAQLETLTVIAYRGPITRPELEQIRGALIIRNLLLRGLVEEAESDKKLLPVYSLSLDALKHLGISSVTELVDYENLSQHEFLEPKE
jgi:segregation and condensation protein B